MTNLVISLNTDTQDQSYNTSGIEWTDVDTSNDYLLFTAGSNIVKDGEPLPTDSERNQAGVRLTGVETIVSLYLLADYDADELKEVHLMGNQDSRYVIAFDFDGATASEPVLELWDDFDMDTVALTSLGSGTPSSSWWRGVVTTDASPGADWAGSRLAGASTGHFLWLNNLGGALSGAETLYANLKIVIPATATISGAESPVLVVKYTSN